MLKDLKPADVAERLVEAIAMHIGRYALPLDLSYRVDLKRLAWTDDKGIAHHDPASSCTIGGTIAILTEWAQTGGGTDWPEEGQVGCARDAIQSVVEAYYGSPSGQSVDLEDIEELAAESQDDPVALVLTAALARVTLLQGHPVTPSRLAALASVSPDRIRQLYEPAGTLVRSGRGQISRDSAVAWLTGRGMMLTAKV